MPDKPAAADAFDTLEKAVLRGNRLPGHPAAKGLPALDIRRAGSADARAIRALYALDPTPGAPADAGIEEALAGIAANGGYVAVATSGNECIATYALYLGPAATPPARAFAVIENVVVHPDFRRLGVGRALMAHAVAQAERLDCSKVLLQTGAPRSGNFHFYLACGFRQTRQGFKWSSK